MGRGCPAAGAFTSRSGTGEGSVARAEQRSQYEHEVTPHLARYARHPLPTGEGCIIDGRNAATISNSRYKIQKLVTWRKSLQKNKNFDLAMQLPLWDLGLRT